MRSRRVEAAPGQEALEHEAVGREAREHQRGQHRARSGDHVDREAGVEAGAHERARRDRRCRASRRRSRRRRRCPSCTASTTQAALSCSLCSCTARSRPAAGTPACVRRARVRRVSSAAITSASRSVSTARGERSPRFPIGVATSTRRPGDRPACAHSRPQLHPVTPGEAPAVEGARLGLDRRTRLRRTTGETRHGREASRAQHHAVARRRTRRRSGTACPRCGRCGTAGARAHRRARRGPSSPRRRARAVSATSAAASTSPSRTSQAIVSPRHTLNRISSTSPSTTS